MYWDANHWFNDQGLQLVSIHSESEWDQTRQAIADDEASSLVVGMDVKALFMSSQA